MIRWKFHLLKMSVCAALFTLALVAIGCGADTPIADPRRPDDARTPSPDEAADKAEQMPFEFEGSVVETKWREAVKDVPTWRADARACRTFCEDWCPRAAECLIGPYSHIGRCKALCLDPCMESLWPAKFVACAQGAKDCAALKACTVELHDIFSIDPKQTKKSLTEGVSP